MEKPTVKETRKLILEALARVYSQGVEILPGDVHGLDALQKAKMDGQLKLEVGDVILDRAIDNIKKKIVS